ncbi:hypothetical protein GCM10027517_15010 [Phycicoccus ginsengisoli]
MTRYLAIARGWLIVAGGAWLIALKETWELVEHHEAGLPAYVAVVLVATGTGLGVTVASARGQRSILEQARGDA